MTFWAGRWYFVITIVSAGLLAWVPFVHAAHRLRRRSSAVLAAIYGAAAAASVVLSSLVPTDANGQITDGVGTALSVVWELLLLSVIIAGCLQQVPLRRAVYGGDPALTAALAARARRDAARQLAATDPLIARELRIGRPDLPRSYDDGGLVDLNSAPAAVIAQACDLTAAAADSIVRTRIAYGGFHTVDDVLTMAEVPIGAWNEIRDRTVVIQL